MHFEKSAVLPLYPTELAMIPRLALKSIKKHVRKCWFQRVPGVGAAGRPALPSHYVNGLIIIL